MSLWPEGCYFGQWIIIDIYTIIMPVFSSTKCWSEKRVNYLQKLLFSTRSCLKLHWCTNSNQLLHFFFYCEYKKIWMNWTHFLTFSCKQRFFTNDDTVTVCLFLWSTLDLNSVYKNYWSRTTTACLFNKALSASQ